jgi:hypothetical protein
VRRMRRLRTGGRLGAAAGLVSLASVVTMGCASTAAVIRVPAPRARILLIDSGILHTVMAQDEPLARTFAGRTTYVLTAAASRPDIPRLAGSVKPTAAYTSYATFAADVTAGRVPRRNRAVLYDIEMWAQTPLAEQEDPRLYMTRFSELAREHGLLPILAPARDLVLVPGAPCVKQTGENLNQAYIRCGLASADTRASVLVVQSQVDQSDVPEFRGFLSLAARQARAANPHVTVLAQLATAPLGQVASLGQIATAARSVRALVQGFSLNARPADIPVVRDLLWSFRRS